MTETADGHEVRKPLTSTMEDYLEAIFDLNRDKKAVRVKDIADRLNVKMPTVTSMMKALSGRGFIIYKKYEYVKLTDSGAQVGREMRRRHEVLFSFLTGILKIEDKTAEEEACKMEHSLSATSLKSLTDFMDFVRTSRTDGHWLDFWEEFRKGAHLPKFRMHERSLHH